MTKTTLTIQKATKRDIPEIIRLLADNNLPTEDVSKAPVQFFLFYQDNQLIGISGIEHYDETALLRSVVIKKAFRNNNLGIELVSKTIEQAKGMKIIRFYLLTTTASEFFNKLGFVETTRTSAPKSIQFTHEFSGLCPDSANFMVLNI